MLQIRQETTKDIQEVHNVNAKAFGREAEAVLVDKMREHGVLTLSLVAVNNEVIVGYIAFSPVEIKSELTNLNRLTLAPVAVLPAYQNK